MGATLIILLNKLIQFIKKNTYVLISIIALILCIYIGYLIFCEVTGTLQSNPNITELWMWTD